MKLYYTPKSHFARKNRILLDALSIDVELIDAGNVADNNPEIFAHNPLMKVPTLVDAELTVYESDHIAHYIVKKFDPDDQFKVLTCDWQQLNARAVMNGVMVAEVELIMAKRTGIDINAYTRFEKLSATVVNGLEWLEKQVDFFVGEPSYIDFHLISLWDHLVLYKMFSLEHPKLKYRVEQLSKLRYIKKSSPI